MADGVMGKDLEKGRHILGYPGGPSLITRVLASGEGRQKSGSERCNMRRAVAELEGGRRRS